MSEFSAHDHIALSEFREAQKIAQRCGVDPRNSADRVWAAHGLLNYTAERHSESDANREMSALLRRQAG